MSILIIQMNSQNSNQIMFRALIAFVVFVEMLCNVEQVTVAFVFAGGVRSFIIPAIHESIRYNLIHSFCPPSKCSADIFVRFSIDDNTHDGQGLSAVGKKLTGSQETLDAAVKKIGRLAHDSEHGKLVYEVVNIGSQEESNQMDALTNKSLKQKIYRDLDPRRYSMYFNRWAAYEMMLREERATNKKYLWVIHSRLDMGWGAPIRPYYVWSMNKVWVPDSWYADVPDTLALLPRRVSDLFFSLDSQYNPDEIMCLGGPNFDVRTVQREALTKRGYSEHEILAALKEDCFNKFEQGGYLVTREKSTNTSWTSAGTSEVYLKRKLKYYGISRDDNTLGFSSFFTFISRYPLNFVCFYIETIYFIPWVKQTQHASNPIGVGCNLMWKQMNNAMQRNYGPNCDLTTFTSKSPLTGTSGATCVLDKGMTDWNFLPYRIRRKGEICLKADSHPGLKVNTDRTRLLHMTHCEATIMKDEYTVDYNHWQLFSFHPLSPLPQRVVLWDFRRGIRCLTVSKDFEVMGANGRRRSLLEMSACVKPESNLSQMFRVQIINLAGSESSSPNATVGSEADSTSLNMPSSLISSWVNDTHVLGGHLLESMKNKGPYDTLIPDKFVAIIKWMGQDETLCVSIDDTTSATESVGGASTGPNKSKKAKTLMHINLQKSSSSDVNHGVDVTDKGYMVLKPCYVPIASSYGGTGSEDSVSMGPRRGGGGKGFGGGGRQGRARSVAGRRGGGGGGTSGGGIFGWQPFSGSRAVTGGVAESRGFWPRMGGLRSPPAAEATLKSHLTASATSESTAFKSTVQYSRKLSRSAIFVIEKSKIKSPTV